LTKEMRL